MLDVRRMKVLREVAARGSFSAAAEALSFTQSAISQQIAALERETGATLLERSPRGVRLTDAGTALVSHADAILARLDDAEEELAALAGLRGGRLRLATFQSGGATLVPRAVKAFHDRHPAVDLSMVEAEPDEAQELLRSGAVDLAVLYDFEPVPNSLSDDLELAHLIDDPYEAVIAEGHSLARKRGLRLADMGEEPWISSTSRCGCRAITDRACRDAGFEPRVAFEADETMAAQGLRRRRGRRHDPATARPQPAALRRGRPLARSRRAGAAHLGRPSGRGLPLAGERGDGAGATRRRRGVPRGAGAGGGGVSVDAPQACARASPARSSRSRRSRSSSGEGSKPAMSGSESSASRPNSFSNSSVVR